MIKLTPKLALKELLVFALPIIVGHLGLMLIGTGDMMIAGRYSRECLAAIGLAMDRPENRHSGLSYWEMTYRCFMSFYGLVVAVALTNRQSAH